MKLTAKKIPDEFIRAIPRGFRLVNKKGHDYLLVESLFCPNGHNLIVDSVRIHGESSIKLQAVVNQQSGFLFVDAFWGSHSKLFSFIPRISEKGSVYVEIHCPYCNAEMMEQYSCAQKGCGSEKGVVLLLPGGKNKIHVCARLGCPGHVLDTKDLPARLARSVSVINYFGAGPEDPFGGI